MTEMVHSRSDVLSPHGHQVTMAEQQREDSHSEPTFRRFRRLYVDQEGCVRGDHEIRFLGVRVITLHYRMAPRNASDLLTRTA